LTHGRQIVTPQATRVCFGCTSFGSQFYDLGWFNNPGTTWGLWTSNEDPPAPAIVNNYPPYTYIPYPNSAYYNFILD
jgi:hypothetical protein